MKNLLCLLLISIFNAALVFADGEPATVMVEKAKLSDIYDEVSYPARVQSKVNATVRADTDGVVTKLSTNLGSKVTRGTVLLQIKNDDPVYQYVSINQTSPVSGVVSSFEIAEGASVKKGQSLLTIVDPDKLKINVEVTASDLKNIKPGFEGIFEYQVAGGATQKITAKVSGVSPLIDGLTGTATAEMTAQFSNREVGPGYLGKVVFQLNKRKGIQVPEQAITYRGNATFLRLVENDTARNVKIKMGRTQRGLVEVVDGAKADKLFVVSTSGFVADGEKVKVQEVKNESENVKR